MNTPKDLPAKEKVEVEFYTDPFCCWSWAMEPAWRRLRYEFGDQVNWKFRMSGMFPGTNTSKNGNGVTPEEIEAVWKEAAKESAMPIDTGVWQANRPDSSFLACLAVKTAERQAPEAAEAYLHQLRETLMVEGRNVSQVHVLLDVAHELVKKRPDVLDYSQFKAELIEKTAYREFQNDMEMSDSISVSRYPTIVISKGNDRKVLAGYHSYDDILSAINRIDPVLKPQRQADCSGYQEYWGNCRPEELDAIASVKATNPKLHANSMAS